MFLNRRRLTLATATGLLSFFCVQLILTHYKLENVNFLDDQSSDTSYSLNRIGQELEVDGGLSAAFHQLTQKHLPNPAILVFCYNRVDYLNKTLHSLASLRGIQHYTVYISQDGDHEGVKQLVTELAATLFASQSFHHWIRPRIPELGESQPGSAWLAQHYGWGLQRVFMKNGHSHSIIVEDDMLFSPDFLSYFEATAELLDADPTLWCVSSWNDNGFSTWHEWDTARLFRTSYFPGLGWMMKRELWLELGPKWPKDHWDHWMRMEHVSKGRECISPEVSRNKNIGEVGANMNKSAFKRYLATMEWSQAKAVNLGDLGYLIKPAFTAAMQSAMASAEGLDWKKFKFQALKPNHTYLATYKVEEYSRLANKMKLWPYPRGHHQHVASIPFKGARVLLADSRFCPLLPVSQQIYPTPGMQAVASIRNQSCTDTCQEAGGLACHASDFWFINFCSALMQHFPCERGCSIELDEDVPNYVMDQGSPGYQLCLITQRTSTCEATNPGAARLCPCSRVDLGSRQIQQESEQQYTGQSGEERRVAWEAALSKEKVGHDRRGGSKSQQAGQLIKEALAWRRDQQLAGPFVAGE